MTLRMPRRLALLSAVAVFAMLSTACGRASVRLTEVEHAGGNISKVIYNNDGTIEEIETEDSDGDFATRLEFTWNEGRIEEVRVLDNNVDTFTLEYDYDSDGRLQEALASRGGQSMTIEYEFDADNGYALKQHDVNVDFGNGILNHVRGEYDYADGKIAELETTTDNTLPILGTSTDVVTEEFDWDGELLDRVTRESNNTDVYRFDYNDDNTLDEIDWGDEMVELDYDDGGRIEEIDFTYSNGSSDKTEYTYEDGSVAGLTFTPGFPYGAFFDMSGRPFGTPDVMTPAYLVAFFGN